MSYEELMVRFNSKSPILMHSDKLANPLGILKKQFSAISAKRKKTDDDYVEMARLEWVAGMYHDEECGPYIPGMCIKAMLIRSATKTKKGTQVKAGVVVTTDKAALLYEGPRDIVALWEAGKFADSRSVVVGKSRIMRTRPRFDSWTLEVRLHYDIKVINREDLLNILSNGGRLVGLGDYRLEKGGDFGRFSVEVLNG